MRISRDTRRCALQALYQFDAGAAEDLALVRESLAESPGDDETHEHGYQLATLAWEFRAEADDAVAAITPEWPTYRQPMIDRNLLRLAYYEMHHGETPPKVAINEAVELAREFSTEKSPMFVNGVLDKLFRQMRGESDPAAPAARDDDPAPEIAVEPTPGVEPVDPVEAAPEERA